MNMIYWKDHMYDRAEVDKWPLVQDHHINPACGGGSLGSIGNDDCICIPRHVTKAEDEAHKPVDLPAWAPLDLVDNNPKTRQGVLKAPLHLIPPSAKFHLAEALENGAAKYGAYNWREEEITTSVYIGAIERHLCAYVDGEDMAQDSGVHHLAHIMACCALVLDAKSIDKLKDDRPTAGASPRLLDEYHRQKL